MTSGSIFSNEAVMLSTAQAFEASSTRMGEARMALSVAAENLAAAWKGAGSAQFETIKDVADAHCLKMAEMAAVEAGNIRSAAGRYRETDAALAGLVGHMGR